MQDTLHVVLDNGNQITFWITQFLPILAVVVIGALSIRSSNKINKDTLDLPAYTPINWTAS